jgi:hypothetical protein
MVEDFQRNSSPPTIHAEYQPQKRCCGEVLNICCPFHCGSGPKVHRKNIHMKSHLHEPSTVYWICAYNCRSGAR